jgi:hypothetical protein
VVRPTPNPSPFAERGAGSAATTNTERTEPKAIETGAVATATYIAGSTSLEPGARYIIGVDGARLRLLGPVDVDPSAVALAFEIADVDASVIGGRLLISQHRGSGAVLAFMSVAGMTPDRLASAIVGAAQEAARS